MVTEQQKQESEQRFNQALQDLINRIRTYKSVNPLAIPFDRLTFQMEALVLKSIREAELMLEDGGHQGLCFVCGRRIVRVKEEIIPICCRSCSGLYQEPLPHQNQLSMILL